jgi:hypothetical protein
MREQDEIWQFRANQPNLQSEQGCSSSRRELRYVLIVPVWGDHHTTLFLRYFIPFLLTEGNIGVFAKRRLEVHVASRRSDFARMHENAHYKSVAAFCDLRETEIDGLIDLSLPHRAMTECYLHVVNGLPHREDVVTILPTPDCILSRNALKRIVELMESGWRAVVVCGLRLTLETAGPLFDRMLAEPEGVGRINERELCSVVLNNLHPITLTCDAASNEFMDQWPSHVYWIAPDRSWLLAHCFHLHPIAVRGIPKSIDICTTIDGDYLVGLGVSAQEIYVVTDSDEFFCVELSPRAKQIAEAKGRLTQRALVRFSVVSCNPLHRAFYEHAIRWRGSQELKIPENILREAEDSCLGVRRGSKVEELRHMVIMMIRRVPLLLFVARLAVRAPQWARRRLGWTARV